MFSTFVTLALALALALVGTVEATPVAPDTTLTPTITGVNAPGWVPVVTQDLNGALAVTHGNKSGPVGKNGQHADSAENLYPATFFLCLERDCGSCTGYDLSIQPHQTCLAPGFNFASMYIDQPSNQGLPFGVSTGPIGCGTFYGIPNVNTCFNADNYIGWDFELGA